LCHGVIPQDWKITNITTVFKRGQNRTQVITGH